MRLEWGKVHAPRNHRDIRVPRSKVEKVMSQAATTAGSVPASSVASTEQYNYAIVKRFAIAAVLWGVFGMAAGVWIASQLAFPFLNFDIAQITFGRFRPVHTTAVIFGFGGNALFATSYYVVQRTCQTRLYSDSLSSFTFYGWNLALILGVITYMMGITQGREYAEFNWQIDIIILVVWVAYFWIYLQTLLRRNQPHIYVANWFFMSFILATALLHIFNNLEVPVGIFHSHSYPLFSGVQDAMRQWWYGHNAVGFFLTAAFLGMMYYFVPKQAVDRSIRTSCRSSTSGRWCSCTCGWARITCTGPPCRTGSPPWRRPSPSCCCCPPGVA